MSLRLASQRDVQRARRALNHCYICADPLPSRGSVGRTAVVVGDHVVPSSILDLAPAPSSENWPLILDIHKECEHRHKRSRDQLAKIMQVFGSRGPYAWHPEELGLFRNRCGIEKTPMDGKEIPVVLGGNDALLAASLWARGFHAALYKQVMPNPARQWTQCPVPSFDAASGPAESQVEDGARCRHLTLAVVAKAVREGNADSVVLRGGSIQYYCVWLEVKKDRETPWWCFWALDLPGSTAWSTGVTGEDVPWHGSYTTALKPTDASVAAQQNPI